MCPQGTTGLPLRGCTLLPMCGFNSDCPLNEACVDSICRDPCDEFNCVDGATCIVEKHRPLCECAPGYVKFSDGSCRRDGCIRDEECPHGQICANGKCSDPCDKCGIGAKCVRQRQEIICMCPPGTSGNPSKLCIASKH